MAQKQYIELICSLPHLHNPFVQKRPPITAVQFRKRFNMLDLGDQKLILALAEAFYWGRISLASSDETLIRKAGRLLDRINSPDLKGWLLWRMDMRALMAALRRRKKTQESPGKNERWGYGRYVRAIENNWSHPYFKLEGRFTWLVEANTLLGSGDSFALEKLLLSTAWNYYSHQQADTRYSFSDVWLYSMKWDLVNRWCQYNAEQARVSFDQMVVDGLLKPTEELRAMV